MRDQEKRVDGSELVPQVAPHSVPDLKLAEFELHLARAMRRVEAPEGFAARVMARTAHGAGATPTQVSEARPGAPGSAPAPGSAASEGRPFDRLRAGSGAPGVLVFRKRSRLLRIQAWSGGAIAAALAIGMFGAEQLHLRRERAEQAAKADQQFAVAVQVTDHALAQTREQLQRAGLNLGE